MGSDGLPGAFEEQVMLAVARCGDDAYGMTVRRELEARTGRDVSIGAVYSTLARLESKTLIASRLVDSGTPERRGRARRFFRLLPAGAEALREAREVHRALWDGLDPRALADGDVG